MSKRKSKKRGKAAARNQLRLNDVIFKFDQQDYFGAASLLKKAKITSENAGQAKQLKTAILHQIGFQYFLDKKYTKTIELLASTLKVQSKPGFPLPLRMTHILMGLSYLYLGQFDKAASFLNKATQQKASSTVSFYQLLALIYSQKNTTDSFAHFSKTEQTAIATLEADQQAYLEIAWSLVRENFGNAGKLLAHLSSKDEIEEQNIRLLHKLVQGKAPSTADHIDDLKTLYKVLANIEPSETDSLYLRQFEAFEDYLFLEEKQAQAKKIELQLSRMCNEGIPLTEAEFLLCYNEIRDDLKPYLVYNQISNLNNTFKDKNNSQILRYLRKYNSFFFQIPESAFLYLEIVSLNTDKIRTESFWRSLTTLIDRFGKSMTYKQLDSLSWKIQFCCMEGDFSRHQNGQHIAAFSARHPNLIGVKFQIFMEQSFGIYKRISNEVKDVFSLEGITENKDKILSEFQDLIHSFSPDVFFSFHFSSEAEEASALLEKHFNLQDTISEYITLYPRIEDKSILKEMYTIISESVNKVLTEYSEVIDQQSLTKLENKIQENLKTLNLNKQIFSIKSVESILVEEKKRSEIQHILYDANTTVGTKNFFLKCIYENDYEILNEELIKEIDDGHFDEILIPKLTLFFKLLVEEIPEKVNSVLRLFNQEYEKISKDLHCEHPHDFYCMWLKDLFSKAKHTTYQPFVYQVLESYHDKLLNPTESISYNTALAAVKFIMKAIKTTPDFNYDINLVVQLVSCIKIAAQKRKLKGLSSALIEIELFFEDLDKQ